jgi:hypothetical protein
LEVVPTPDSGFIIVVPIKRSPLLLSETYPEMVWLVWAFNQTADNNKRTERKDFILRV